ncbi:flagellin [Colwellia sp. RSH04]|uniref:flagellin N-terminal helical domain-containing protein n=1 Tax=Colwellia sp. RSH04 TaxID=2305464 RepID=UPI000E59189C|nr:flagellin [Colwellia sp. RSH04]RHW75958.1 flagellin [Colwellia sp. RSH04]
MALYVNTNISSLFSQRKMAGAINEMDVSYKRLSTGMRINSATDDAAGLQIANRLTSQILGLNQGNRNANDGISLTQSIEGAMEEVSTMLRRVRSLASQASNGSNSGGDRLALQEEVRALSAEVNRIADDTTFAKKKILDGSFSTTIQVGSDAMQVVSFDMKSVGGSAAVNSLTMNGGFTLSGIAGIASTINNQGLTSLAKGISTISGVAIGVNDDFSTKFRASSISISSTANAQFILAGVDSLIAVVNKKRAELGAVQNRFQSTIRNQSNNSENLSAAKSRIQDTDFALETAKLTKFQILQQASSSILSQANQRPQLALSLLN